MMSNPAMRFALVLFAVAATFAECQGSRVKKTLPASKPTVRKLEFTSPAEGWPPRPKGRTNVVDVASQPIRGALDDEMEMRIRQSALEDTRVRHLLGRRFTHIETDEVELEKGRRRGNADTLATRTIFFSYEKNVAVEVRMRGTQVIGAASLPAYSPPEGIEEINAAIALARADARISGQVTGLDADAILAPPHSLPSGAVHRVLTVNFIKAGEDLPNYSAVVDLTDGKVLVAGPSEK